MTDDSAGITGYRFGPFEVDFECGELRRSGIRLRLQEKPLQVLRVLLQSGGRMVSREDLYLALWPGDVYVDFENSLNTAVNKLRGALNDPAESPRYIETLHRRGYRFLTPVEPIYRTTAAAHLPAPFAAATPGAPDLHEPSPEALVPGPAAVPPAWRTRILWAVVAAGVSALALITWHGVKALRPEPIQPSAESRRPRLVVLPFQDLTSGEKIEYLGEALTEEVTSQLARLDAERLGVIARTSAEAFRGTSRTALEIGRTLGADYLLEGSVQRSDDGVRVHVQLIRASDQTHLWSETFDRPDSTRLSLQSEVARRVARSLAIELLPGQRAALDRASTVSVAAYEAYLHARDTLLQKSENSGERAEALFLRAIALDPNFALAYATLSECYSFRSSAGEKGREFSRKAEEAARKAIALDPMLAEGYTALAQVALIRWQWNQAEDAMQRALRLNGSDGRSMMMYAKYLSMNGRYDEAVRHSRRAAELDPQVLGVNGSIGWLLLQAGYYREAQTEAEKLLQRGRGQLRSELDGHWMLGSSLLGQGRMDAAVTELEKAHRINNQIASLWVDLATAYWHTGQRERALAIARDLEKEGPRFAFLVATMYARFQMHDQAITYLEKAWETRNSAVFTVNHKKEFALMRSDPRFKKLQGKLMQAIRSNN